MALKTDAATRRKILELAGEAPKRRRSRAPAVPSVPADGVILAIDAASIAAGWVVMKADRTLVDYAVVKATASWPLARRAEYLGNVLAGVAERYEPADVVMETSTGQMYRVKAAGGGHKTRSPRSIVALSFAQGVIYRAVRAAGFPVGTVDEVTWSKRRPKASRARTLHLAYPTFGAWAEKGDPGLDVTDALGIAIWYLDHHGA